MLRAHGRTGARTSEHARACSHNAHTYGAASDEQTNQRAGTSSGRLRVALVRVTWPVYTPDERRSVTRSMSRVIGLMVCLTS